MDRKLWCSGLAWALEFALVFSVASAVSAQNKSEKSAGAGATGTLAGLGSISGTVKAPKEFKAAKVYVKNVDKNVVYMVFTEGGRYQAVDLFPGNYEVSVTKNGFVDSGRAENHDRFRRKRDRGLHPERGNLPAEPANAQRPSQR